MQQNIRGYEWIFNVYGLVFSFIMFVGFLVDFWFIFFFKCQVSFMLGSKVGVSQDGIYSSVVDTVGIRYRLDVGVGQGSRRGRVRVGTAQGVFRCQVIFEYDFKDSRFRIRF